jgi:hypothetical protein
MVCQWGQGSVPGWPEWPRGADGSSAVVGRGVGDCPVVKTALLEVMNEKRESRVTVDYRSGCLPNKLSPLLQKGAGARALRILGRCWAGAPRAVAFGVGR